MKKEKNRQKSRPVIKQVSEIVKQIDHQIELWIYHMLDQVERTNQKHAE